MEGHNNWAGASTPGSRAENGSSISIWASPGRHYQEWLLSEEKEGKPCSCFLAAPFEVSHNRLVTSAAQPCLMPVLRKTLLFWFSYLTV